MKKNVFVNILNFLIPIFICLLLFTLAKIPYYPKLKQNSKLPSYIKWNCHTGEYYNSKNFKWDNKLKTYTQINRSIDNSARGIFGDDKQFKDWKKKHKYSKNLLDMRIIRATEKVASGTERLSYFNPHMDNRLKCIAQLGLEELPTMLKRIKNDSEIATVLRTTIFVMTKARPEYCDQSDEGRDLYVLNYITRIKNSKHIIINAYNRLKLEINPETRTNIKKEITNVGIWALPYAFDEFKKGHNELLNIFKEEYGEDFINVNLDVINDVSKILTSKAFENAEDKSKIFWVYPEALEHR